MDKIRIILAGPGGGRGYWFASEIIKHPDFELVAMVDRIEQTAVLAAKHLGITGIPIFPDCVQALDSVECDAILVATSDSQHVVPTVAALERGKYVYVEKPLSITLFDCLKIARADKAAGGKTLVGFNLRFAPLYAHLQQRARKGDLGDLLTIQADEFYHGGKTYFRRWNRLREFGGGLWITKACHDFDLLYFMAGKLPLRVNSVAGLSYYKNKPEAGEWCRECPIEKECPDSAVKESAGWDDFTKELMQTRDSVGWRWDMCLFNSDKDTHDHGIATVEFEDKIYGTYTLNVVAAFTDRTMRLSGTKGTMQGALSTNDLTHWERYDDSAPSVSPLVEGEITGGHGGGDSMLLTNFAAFVRGESARVTTPAEAGIAVAMGQAATMSSDTNKVVEMEEVPGWTELLTLLK